MEPRREFTLGTAHRPGRMQPVPRAVTIDGSKVTRNPAYYIIAHASKFARPGSVRIAFNTPPALPNVAFKTPDGRRVLIVLNNSQGRQTFNLAHQGKLATSALNSNAVGTFVW